jgi:hypothetical protein
MVDINVSLSARNVNEKSAFFDFFNDIDATQFAEIVQASVEDPDYINWNEFLLPKDYGDAEKEYWGIRKTLRFV